MISKIYNEALAGLTVSIVALPLALAFGIAATGTPEGALVGLYGAIFAGFFAALFGGTPGQVTGPTGPITVIATIVIAEHGLEQAFITFILAGIIQIIFGVIKIGNAIQYIKDSVISGFMNGIALIILIGQMKYLTASPILVGLTIVLILLSKKGIKSIPATLVALLGGTLFALLFKQIGWMNEIELIGKLPNALPMLHIPTIDESLLISLLPSALSIAVLGSIDSLLTSVVMDKETNTKHNSNKELIGQGIGNLVSGFFGGLAGAGATVRSIVNLQSGGKTALSACFHSVFLFLILIGLGGFIAFVPQAVLAGILVFTAFTMFDWETIKKGKGLGKEEIVIIASTMILTVTVDLMIAVAVGVALTFMFEKLKKRSTQKVT